MRRVARSWSTEQQRWPALLLVLGGLTAVADALSPWFTLYAGLRPLTGISGLFGQFVLAGGGLLVIGGSAYAYRGGRRLPAALALLSMLLSTFCLWLVPRQFAVREHLAASAMLIPQLGPGLFIAVGGAIVALLAAAWGWYVECRR